MKMGGRCLNWKVIAGLAVVGVGIGAVAPNLLRAALPLLIVAACPLSMFFMMRGMGGTGGGQCAGQPQQAAQPGSASLPALTGRDREAQLAELRGHLAGMREQHESLARAIARLEATDAPVVREAETVARAADQRVGGGRR